MKFFSESFSLTVFFSSNYGYDYKKRYLKKIFFLICHIFCTRLMISNENCKNKIRKIFRHQIFHWNLCFRIILKIFFQKNVFRLHMLSNIVFDFHIDCSVSDQNGNFLVLYDHNCWKCIRFDNFFFSKL